MKKSLVVAPDFASKESLNADMVWPADRLTTWIKPSFECFALNDAMGLNPFGAKNFIPHFGVS